MGHSLKTDAQMRRFYTETNRLSSLLQSADAAVQDSLANVKPESLSQEALAMIKNTGHLIGELNSCIASLVQIAVKAAEKGEKHGY